MYVMEESMRERSWTERLEDFREEVGFELKLT